MMRQIIVLLFFFTLVACKLPETERVEKKRQSVDLPNQTADSIEVVYSEQGILKLKLRGPKLVMSEKAGSQYNEFPEGMDMEFFDKNGEKNADLVGDYGYDDAQKKQRFVKGNVIINFKGGEVYKTQELYIDEQKDSIHNNGLPVIITKPDGTLIQGDSFYSNSRMDFISIKNVFDSTVPVDEKELNSNASTTSNQQKPQLSLKE